MWKLADLSQLDYLNPAGAIGSSHPEPDVGNQQVGRQAVGRSAAGREADICCRARKLTRRMRSDHRFC